MPQPYIPGNINHQRIPVCFFADAENTHFFGGGGTILGVPKFEGFKKNTVRGRNPAPVDVGSLSHYLQGFKHLRWCRISSINRSYGKYGECFVFKNNMLVISDLPSLIVCGINKVNIQKTRISKLTSSLAIQIANATQIHIIECKLEWHLRDYVLQTHLLCNHIFNHCKLR